MLIKILTTTDETVTCATNKLEELIKEYLDSGYRVQGGISTTYNYSTNHRREATASGIVIKEK